MFAMYEKVVNRLLGAYKGAVKWCRKFHRDSLLPHLCVIKGKQKDQSPKKQTLIAKNKTMKKIALFATILTLFTSATYAQLANTSASQTTNLVLTNAIDMTFTATGTATGPLVSLPFTTTNDYANGVASSAQQLKVRSNKNFNVTVKSNATNFSYTGTTTPAPVMPVASVLDVKVSANGTGGAIAGTFANYSDITTTAQNIITGGTYGGNQTFSVMYQATPGWSYPAGTYAVDVTYTATQQ